MSHPHRSLPALVCLTLLLGVPPGADAAAAPQPPALDRYGTPLPPDVLARMGGMRLRHEDAEVVFATDGKSIISAGRDLRVRRWDRSTGRLLASTPFDGAGSAWVTALAADGAAVAAGPSPSYGQVRVWDAGTGRERCRMATAPPLDLSVIAFSPDGRVVAAAGDIPERTAATVRLWDASTGKELRSWSHVYAKGNHPWYFHRLAFSPDGKWLAVGFKDRTVRVWDTANGREVGRTAGASWAVAFVPGGKEVAFSGGDGVVTFWSPDTGRSRVVFRGAKPLGNCLAFSPDGRLMALGGNGEVVLADVASGKTLHRLPEPFTLRLTFSPDGKTLASSGGGTIRLWDVGTGKRLLPTPGHDDTVYKVVLSPDGKLLASAGAAGTIHLWDVATGAEVRSFKAHGGGGVTSLAFSPDGTSLASGGYDNTFCLWDVATGRARSKAETPGTAIGNLAYSPDGRVVVSAGARLQNPPYTYVNHLSVWDASNGKLVRDLADGRQTSGIGEIRFSLDGKLLASAEGEGRVRLWDVASWKVLRELPAVGMARHVAFSPDGKVLAMTDQTATRFYNAITGVSLFELSDPQEAGYRGFTDAGSPRFSPDGRAVLTLGRTARLWETATGQMRHDAGEASMVKDARFLPGGRAIAAFADGNGSIVIRNAVGAQPPRPNPFGAEELERLWADLAGDAVRACRAIRILAAAPAMSVPFLAARLRSHTARDIGQLLADLDDDDFTVRERATSELGGWADPDEPALVEALRTSPSLEVRSRLQRILRKLGTPLVTSPGRLRTIRAVEVLERVGGPEVKGVLQRLARSGDSGRLAREVKAALHRLDDAAP